MGEKLQKHAEAKAKKVNGWDIISTFLGLGGTALVVVSFTQPKNIANSIRLPAAFGLFAASVVAERCRESELLSLDRATEYLKNLQTERIKLDAVLHQTKYEIQQVEDFYQDIPIDRQPEVAARIGYAPPNYAARQPDPVLSFQPVAVSTAPPEIQIPDEDPSLNYDPERISSGSIFIPAELVESWFKSHGKDIPQSLIEDWQNSEGAIGIEIHDGSAHVAFKEV
jgi:hypothetical protein